MLLKNSFTSTPSSYALFALLCFQSSRLRSKTNEDNKVISLKDQNRNDWYWPLIKLGHQAMTKAVEKGAEFGQYHYEAAIVAEHLRARTYEETNWSKLLMWYHRLSQINPSQLNQLNIAIIHLQLNNLNEVKEILDKIDSESLEQRKYLYHGLLAEYYSELKDKKMASKHIEMAISLVRNESEKEYLEEKRNLINKKAQ